MGTPIRPDFEMMAVDRYAKAIDVRWSRRVYVRIPLEPEQVKTKEELIAYIDSMRPEIVEHTHHGIQIAEDLFRADRLLRDKAKNDAIGNEFLAAIMDKLK